MLANAILSKCVNPKINAIFLSCSVESIVTKFAPTNRDFARVNSFLPSYERIVNYAIIPRDFLKGKNEITSKNTYKRKNIIKNFSNIIKPMYEKSYISLIKSNYEIRIPNWLLREKRITRRDIFWDGKQIREYDLEEGLKNTIKWFKNYSGNFK